MSECFIGEIRIFAGNYAPRGWAFCDGSLISISDNPNLFSLFGTIYGGDGQTNFALPDMRSRIPVHAGSGPGRVSAPLGYKAGAEQVHLTLDSMGQHDHSIFATTLEGDVKEPSGMVPATNTQKNLYAPNPANVSMNPEVIVNSGGNQSHYNMQPYTCVNFIVALSGSYPQRP